MTPASNSLWNTGADQIAPAGLPPRRLLLVAPSPPPYGGMALQARLLEKLLRRDGNSVTFFASNAFPHRLRPLERLRGVRTVVRAAWIWLDLWKQVERVEVVHVLAASWVYFFLVVYPAVIVGRIRGKRVIVNYRGGEARRFFRWFGWIAKPVFKLADVVTSPSEFLSEVIYEYFGVPVRIVSNILDTSVFQFRQRTQLEPKMLVTRHLEKIYDIESVLRAFQAAQEHYPKASLWIAGTGSQEEHLRALAARWNLQNVRFLGGVAHADLPAIYDQCDIYLNASRVDNFPGSLIEASAAGLVVISTCAGGIPFIYRDGKNALLVEPGDWQGLAGAVKKVLESPSLARGLTTEALALARACDWKQVRRSIYEAYRFPIEEGREEILGLAAGSSKELA